MSTVIKSKEFDTKLHGFVLSLEDGRKVNVIFKFQAVRGGGYYPMIARDLELTDEEAIEIRAYILTDKDIQKAAGQYD